MSGAGGADGRRRCGHGRDRGLENTFTRKYSELAPLGYPALHHLTSGLRRAATAAGNPELVHLWAGTGYRNAATGPAGAILTHLASAI